MKNRLVLTGILMMGFVGAHNAFADEFKVPFVGEKWHCTATDNHPKGHYNRSWSGEGRHYEDARDNAMARCQKHSDRPRSCEVHKRDCHH